jgi:hypothetical protein
VKKQSTNYISRRSLLRFIGTAIGTGLVAGSFYDLDTGIVTPVA